MKKFKQENWKNPVYSWCPKIEVSASKQIDKLAQLPFTHKHIAIMPDCHCGYGMPIGGVIALKNAVSPNMVGVDIGCGVCAVKTSLENIDTKSLKKTMGEIRKAIPVGYKKHKEKQNKNLIPPKHKLYFAEPSDRDNFICDIEYSNALKSLGTLGGGNHFIEIQKGDDNHIWIMIHSGSRNLGKQVCDYYKKLAYNLNHKWYANIPEDNLDNYLGFFPADSKEGQDYIREMQYCVDYAFANRKLMMKRVLAEFFAEIDEFDSRDLVTCNNTLINIAHNYASQENHFGQNVWVHRKGATQAKKGQIGIIPGSLGSPSYITEGLGNKNSFCSSPHGAGRKLGRKNAIKTLSLKNEIEILDKQKIIHGLRNQTDLEEATSCYKDINEVMENSKDLVKILVRLQPLASIKG